MIKYLSIKSDYEIYGIRRTNSRWFENI